MDVLANSFLHSFLGPPPFWFMICCWMAIKRFVYSKENLASLTIGLQLGKTCLAYGDRIVGCYFLTKLATLRENYDLIVGHI